MPAISNQDGWATMVLERREWSNTIGQSGMTPTAFAFLIPVFVVVVFCPFLCVFCIRRRQRPIPPRIKPQKKPALRREEARQRLALVTDVVSATEDEHKTPSDAAVTQREDVAETASTSERECAICLSTLHAPSPPEPVLLTSQPTVDDAALPIPPPTTDPTAPDTTILKLQICAHEFHSECLVSWFVLRKTTCPICRAAYISKEDMKAYEDEEAAVGVEQMGVVEPGPPVMVGGHVIGAVPAGRVDANGMPVSNWRYFWSGEGVWGGRRQARVQSESGNLAQRVEEGGVARVERPSRWRRMLGRS